MSHPVKSEKLLPSEFKNSDYKRFLNDLPIPILICNPKGIIKFFNTSFCELSSKPIEVGNSIFENGIISFLDALGNQIPDKDSPLTKVIKEGKAQPDLKVFLSKTDDIPHVMSTRIYRDDNNNIIDYQFSFKQHSPFKKIALKKNTLSAIVESSNDAIISKNLDGIITSWNKGAEKIFGYTEKEVLNKHISILIPENRLQEEQLILGTVKSGKSLDHFETVRVAKSGTKIPLSLTVSPIKDDFGKIIGASKVARDISERLKGEEKQARLSAIVESSDDAIISKDLCGIIKSWNIGATRIFGYKEEEVLDKSITILIPKNRLQEEEHILSNIHSGKRIEHFETIRVRKDGTKIPVSLTVSPIKDSKGNIIGASKIARNIEEQVKSKKKIENFVEKLRILNSVGKDISSKLDIETVLQKVTDATTKLSGAKFGAFFYNKEKDTGEKLVLYTLSGAPKAAVETFGKPRYTEFFEPTFTNQEIVRLDDITKDSRYGQEPPFQCMPSENLKVTSYMAVPVISNSGNIIGGLIFGHPDKARFTKEHEIMVRNIASQAAVALDNSQLFERVISLSEKKDEFIALASHELKTPLTTIKGYLQILEKKIEEPSYKRFLTKTIVQADRLNTLIDDLLNMSRIEAGKLEFNYEVFDLREMLQDLEETFNYSESSHKLITNLGEKPLIINADRQRIEQVLNNLLSNAVKYSPHADKVYLELTHNKNKAIVSVIDEGLGLNPEQQKKVFSRFYRAESTKGINGLGLGLYLSQQIIAAHQGELAVESEVGKGSKFYFSIPLNINEN
ncbi:PAS domain S-box protein [Christiangramia aquimixticola]|uniref:PAS domain S-box protein n=1 Tax=Christiangramia aquimixticola TaxID=1697558 RepID=UPI003AA836D3